MRVPTGELDNAHVVALPPLIVVATLALGLLVQFFWPMRFMPRAAALWLGAILIVAAIPIIIAAVLQLINANTTVDVRKPTTEIVADGVYNMTRNPIYLSMMLGFLGIASLMEREERYLDKKFGEKYRTYRARVRRWI
jgi:protein-S-isoprenylcysteine O-methyltransferase Ste14